ncbi:zinc transport system ATP-binding protein [Thermotomaculum hydrothermale]|uniref:Zinc transport system ATP-binding protein n=1 Tax=Thermotomaculum hydrothermale TaxID=981385 RepID=A0A7R6PF34_9BACT|nr:metal ABC transporter ATP-binding protein [Thermotomaculum hydrothermale]BBB32554.1 zinc transport system ATP-binding protein [Thermotomaculum hydrothermale]
MSLPYIFIEDLEVKYGNKVVLEDIFLKVEKGEIVSIVGPNGGGKTTLLKVILGLKDYSKGTIKVLGKNPKEVDKKEIGYLPQREETAKNFPISVFETVLMGRYPKIGLFRKPGEKDKEIALESLKLVKMDHLKDENINKLSGGQRQRVFIARALAMEPKILILDEPSTGLDIVAQEDFYKILVEIRNKKEMSIIMVSHDIGVVSTFVDKIACLNKTIHYHGKSGTPIPKDVLEKVFGSNIQILVHDPHCKGCHRGEHD